MNNQYWVLNKRTGEPNVFGSITAIEANTALKKDKLYYHFTRKKETEYEDHTYRICKLKIIRSKNEKTI